MTELPILYSFRRCPYAMRARMALLISGTICEIREISLKNKPAEMITASPKATVPVLVLPGGRVIDESLDIMHWALGQSDPEGWLTGDDKSLIAENDGPFKYHLDRYKYASQYDADPARHREAALAWLGTLDARLAHNMNLSRNIRSLGDIAVMPFVRQFAKADQGWFDAQPLPHLQGWLNRHAASKLFQQAILRLPLWQAGDAPTLLAAM